MTDVENADADTEKSARLGFLPKLILWGLVLLFAYLYLGSLERGEQDGAGGEQSGLAGLLQRFGGGQASHEAASPAPAPAPSPDDTAAGTPVATSQVAAPIASVSPAPDLVQAATAGSDEGRGAVQEAASGKAPGPTPDSVSDAADSSPAPAVAEQAADSADARAIAREEAKAFARSVMDQPGAEEPESSVGAHAEGGSARDDPAGDGAAPSGLASADGAAGGADAGSPAAVGAGAPPAQAPPAAEMPQRTAAGDVPADAMLDAYHARRLQAIEAAQRRWQQPLRPPHFPVAPPPSFFGYPASAQPPYPYPTPMYRY
ncbi:MAG: hypothetical protein K9M02_04645 [Thiohalocapsa sp.]|nr:hypothetical protein [Thiohalocapsa sp.]